METQSTQRLNPWIIIKNTKLLYVLVTGYVWTLICPLRYSGKYDCNTVYLNNIKITVTNSLRLLNSKWTQSPSPFAPILILLLKLCCRLPRNLSPPLPFQAACCTPWRDLFGVSLRQFHYQKDIHWTMQLNKMQTRLVMTNCSMQLGTSVLESFVLETNNVVNIPVIFFAVTLGIPRWDNVEDIELRSDG